VVYGAFPSLTCFATLLSYCRTLFDEMDRLQQEYVQRVEEKVSALEIVDGTRVRVLGAGSNGPTIIPTTEELTAYVQEPSTLQKIESAQADALQRAEEKVAISEQTYALVDNICKRLDSDLGDMEKLLQRAGEFQAPGTAKPNDLAAIQTTAGSDDWILAKVVTHDAQTGVYKLSDEDVESNKSKCHFGRHNMSGGIALLTPTSFSVAVFTLPENQVVILGGLKNLSRGDFAYAVYPDTTSFYQATIVQAPRKVSGGGSFVMVNFVDDSDEHGITHDKAVLLQHVMLPPYGATPQ
jgi:hypothetical protein